MKKLALLLLLLGASAAQAADDGLLFHVSGDKSLTADRAGLLCVQDLEPCLRAFMKMAGGARRLYEEMDYTEFVRQIRTYEDADRSNLNKAYKILITLYRTHPFPILRARQLDLWHGEGYRDIAGPRGLLGPGTP